jgi:predicted RNase H-like HicB family nuclease
MSPVRLDLSTRACRKPRGRVPTWHFNPRKLDLCNGVERIFALCFPESHVTEILMPTLKYVVYEEDGAFVAQCLSPDVASEGDTEGEAIANLKEALELYFEDGTIDPTPTGPLRFGELVINA